MNTNPTVIAVSLISGEVKARSTFADIMAQYGKELTPVQIQSIGDELTAKRESVLNDFLLIDVTPTDKEIVAWLKAKVAAAGIDGLHIGCDSGYLKPFYGKAPTVDTYQFGDSAAEVVDRVCGLIPKPADLAAKKRAEAAKLLAEASALETATAQPAAA